MFWLAVEIKALEKSAINFLWHTFTTPSVQHQSVQSALPWVGNAEGRGRLVCLKGSRVSEKDSPERHQIVGSHNYLCVFTRYILKVNTVLVPHTNTATPTPQQDNSTKLILSLHQYHKFCSEGNIQNEHHLSLLGKSPTVRSVKSSDSCKPGQLHGSNYSIRNPTSGTTQEDFF